MYLKSLPAKSCHVVGSRGRFEKIPLTPNPSCLDDGERGAEARACGDATAHTGCGRGPA